MIEKTKVPSLLDIEDEVDTLRAWIDVQQILTECGLTKEAQAAHAAVHFRIADQVELLKRMVEAAREGRTLRCG